MKMTQNLLRGHPGVLRQESDPLLLGGESPARGRPRHRDRRWSIIIGSSLKLDRGLRGVGLLCSRRARRNRSGTSLAALGAVPRETALRPGHFAHSCIRLSGSSGEVGLRATRRFGREEEALVEVDGAIGKRELVGVSQGSRSSETQKRRRTWAERVAAVIEIL